MRSRAGPGRALLLCLALLCTAALSTACATVAKVGGVLHAAGNTVAAIGDVLIDGAAQDVKAGTDAVGITDPVPPAPPKVDAAPAPAPAPEPAPPAAAPEAILRPDDRVLPLAPIRRWSGPAGPSLSPPRSSSGDLDPPTSAAPSALARPYWRT